MAGFLVQIRRVAGAEVVTSRAARRVVMALAFALLTALGAYVAVPLPGTQVPVTLQAMAVILAGALLGPRVGAASQVAYLTAGALGAPVFSGGGAGVAWLFGPTGGYLLAFPAAAAVVGALAGPAGVRRGGARAGELVRLGGALALGSAVILAGGAAQLAILTGDLGSALALGVAPFLVGDVVKILAALGIAARVRGRTLGLV
ncbi:MAG TPA: biotin transporter BioY [Longimicrobiales bacterium]